MGRKSKLFQNKVSKSDHHGYELVLSRAQHYKRAADYRFDIIFPCFFNQLIIFRTRIKNDPFWIEVQDIIIIFHLVFWIEVECNGVNISFRYVVGADGYITHLRVSFSYSYYRMVI